MLKKLIYPLIIIFCLISITPGAFSQDAKQVYSEMYNKAMKLQSISCNLHYSFKSLNEDSATSTFLNLMVKRDRQNTKVPYKIRAQYETGYTFTYDGNFYKYFDTYKMIYTIVDSSQNPDRWINGNWIRQPIKYVFNPDTSYLSNNELVLTPDTKMVNQTECYILYNYKNEHTGEKKDDAIFTIIEQRTEFYIDKNDYSLVRYYQWLKLDDSTTQETSFDFMNLRPEIELSDNFFDLTPPDGYKVENYIEEPEPELLQAGQHAPDFFLNDENGDTKSMKDYKYKVLIIDFWGTWCGWCVKAMPSIQKVYDKYKDKGVEIVGISCREPAKADPPGFMKKKGFTYKLLLGGDSVAGTYRVSGYPTMYIINSEGKIIGTEVGYREDLETHLSKILDEELSKTN